MEAYVFHKGDYDFLDKPVVNIYRKAMRKKAIRWETNPETGEFQVKSTVSNEAVLRYWKLVSIRTELRIRRISMYQARAAHPKHSVPPMGAAFGRIRGEEDAVIPDPIQQDSIMDTATPWALQFHDDIIF